MAKFSIDSKQMGPNRSVYEGVTPLTSKFSSLSPSKFPSFPCHCGSELGMHDTYNFGLSLGVLGSASTLYAVLGPTRSRNSLLTVIDVFHVDTDKKTRKTPIYSGLLLLSRSSMLYSIMYIVSNNLFITF